MNEELKITDKLILKKIDQVEKAYEQHNLDPKEREKIGRLADEILDDLFKTSFSYMIPKSFLDSELGFMLMCVKCNYQYYYSTYDAEIILHRTKANIYYNMNNGRLQMINRGGQYIVTESELKRFMRYKKVSEEEIDKRLEAYWKVKNNHHEKKLTKKGFQEAYKKELKK